MIGFQKIALYWNTVRKLRFSQILYRLYYAVTRPRVDDRSAPDLRSPQNSWEPGPYRPASMLAVDQFNFLNVTGYSDGWNSSERSLLWRYNLHYFDDLNAHESDRRQDWHAALIKRWIMENTAGSHPGWDPYPTSLRIVNWSKYHLSGRVLSSDARHSLAVQARWLSSRIEWHLSGNHVLANAKALVFAGCVFQGREADGWLEKGRSIFLRELTDQILPDGGHYERSPMYQAIAIEDVLDLINVFKFTHGRSPVGLQNTVSTMLIWLQKMVHPDGEIAFFNDAAFGIAPSYAALRSYAQRLGVPDACTLEQAVHLLEDSGYVRVDGERSSLIVDVALLGPDFLPGHGHADTLAFELSLFEQRVVVNSGTSLYESSAERQRQRGTSAHSTVCINGVDSSEVWGGFRVARRAKPSALVIERLRENIRLVASHDGYERLAGRVKHERTWVSGQRCLDVIDSLAGRYETAVANFHFHPFVQLEACGDIVIALLRGGQKVTMSFAGGHASVRDGSWHPEFGITVANQKIEVVFANPTLTTRFKW